MQSFIVTFMARLAVVVDFVTGLIIAFAVAEATVRTARSYIHQLTRMPGHDDAVRVRLGRWLALALEFALASDIIRTAVAPSWDEIGKLAAIMALRTVLNYFLEREFDQAARLEPPEAIRAAA
jgi:uncharacterized membrane protein